MFINSHFHEGFFLRRCTYGHLLKTHGALAEFTSFPRELIKGQKVTADETFNKIPPRWKLNSMDEGFVHKTGTKAILIQQDENLLFDWKLSKDFPEGRVYSLTKSILALLWARAKYLGIAPEDDESLRNLLPEIKDQKVLDLTLAQLWRMDSGIGFTEGFKFFSHQSKTYLHPDCRRILLSIKTSDELSEFFHYNDYHSLLLGLILEKVLPDAYLDSADTKRSKLVNFFESELYGPLGISEDCSWIVDSSASRFPKTESGLVLAAPALLKIGQLVLQNGFWNKKPLLDSVWLQKALARQGNWNEVSNFKYYEGTPWGEWLVKGRGWYGYHWWGMNYKGEDCSFAMGIHGQILLIRPKQRIIALRQGDRWGYAGWWPEKLFDWSDLALGVKA